MGVIQSATTDDVSAGGDSDPDFVFSSNGTVLRAFGVAHTLDTALDGDDFAGGRWDRRLSGIFDSLRAQGMANPVVVGAVPFDCRQPARLFIPRRYSLNSLPDGAAASSAPPSAVAGVREVVDHSAYTAAVRRAIGLFTTTDLRKVVLSRPLDIDADGGFAPARLVDALLQQNPTAYVFSVPVGQGEHLIGASPELLLRKVGRTVLSNPLAGSARRGGPEHEEQARLDALLASEKDRIEHRYVVDAVRDALAPHCRTLSVPDEPEALSTPTMWHLSTRVTGELADDGLSPLRLAHALHPTPAVCGTPHALAHEAIGALEGYARGWYSGMVGWMDSHGCGEWAVTIRCGLVSGTRLRLYAGAGIVAHSCPEAEWEETAAKLRTMLNLFGLGGAVAAAGCGA
ncbi:isochorismate synthase [Azospirillum fermentarium]|uniref:isochorismate synthase n=1 Tax=Azospirillum fermentarium TaxID=1233114 RepID=UPI002226D481|nr:isochorismate synthase [Azospirillum fermentarium]MCW2246585.1 isochorismate synthase [Azospirillum fermentarium]